MASGQPTTKAEREEWLWLYEGEANDHVIQRLIADVERLEAALATISSKSNDEPGVLMNSINRIAKGGEDAK